MFCHGVGERGALDNLIPNVADDDVGVISRFAVGQRGEGLAQVHARGQQVAEFRGEGQDIPRFHLGRLVKTEAELGCGFGSRGRRRGRRYAARRNGNRDQSEFFNLAQGRQPVIGLECALNPLPSLVFCAVFEVSH